MARDGKPGRDPLDKQSKTVLITVKLPESLVQEVDSVFGTGKRSEAIRDALKRHIAFTRRLRARQASPEPPLEENEE